MRLRKLVGRLLIGTMAVTTALTATGVPAAAGNPYTPTGVNDRTAHGGYPEPWRPSIQEDWLGPAGRYCTFPLQVRIVSQDVRVRVLARHTNGTVQLEEYAGPLTVDFVNADTGQAVRRDAGGSGLLEYRPDGTWLRYTIVGPAGFGFRPEDPYARGYYILDGLHVISIDPSGVRDLTLAVGEQDNVCVALGDQAV
ncbi:hypothetical protein GCM10027290_62660 [Micromonospora sonneratiae]|uniref:Uncharacterized protein n=1 Tax=Micromonospora sonneratiae TaxID=1184706 RepID=A0ABW3YEM5_9ACTN